MDLLFNLAEMKIIQSNYGVFKSFAINQSGIPSQVIFVVIINQNEVFTDFKIYF